MPDPIFLSICRQLLKTPSVNGKKSTLADLCNHVLVSISPFFPVKELAVIIGDNSTDEMDFQWAFPESFISKAVTGVKLLQADEKMKSETSEDGGGFLKPVQKILPDDAVIFARRYSDQKWIFIIAVPEKTPENHPEGLDVLMDLTAAQLGALFQETEKKEAVESSNIKSEFLANTSHEIRNSMNVIIGYAEKLVDSLVGSDEWESAQMIRESGYTILDIINDILDISKIEAGSFDLNICEFDMFMTINSVLDTMMLQARTKGIELKSYLSGDVVPFVQGDPGRLRQIFVNLISNGIKFTESGSVNITCLPLESPGDKQENMQQLYFSVRDTGTGIPGKKQDEIFNRYIQVRSENNRRIGGTGLGLSIASQLIHLMGGELQVKSPPEGYSSGSEFHFSISLPIIDRPAFHNEVEQKDICKLKILIAADTMDNAEYITGLLPKMDEAPFISNSDMDCLLTVNNQVLKKQPGLNLVIIYFQQPENNAIQTAELIKQRIESLPVIIIQASGERGDAGRCRTVGVDGYLTGPVSREQLLDTIGLVMNKAERRECRNLITRYTLKEYQRKYKILVVEDTPFNVRLLMEILATKNHFVVVATNGKLAVEALEKEEFDVVLMDIQMPVMDGLEATRIIRDKGINVPVIAMTARAMSDDPKKCMDAGMDDYCSKPIKVNELVPMIHKVVEQKTWDLKHDGVYGNDDGMTEDMAAENSVCQDCRSCMQKNRLNLEKEYSCINVHDGVKRYSGDHDLYVSTLNSFLELSHDDFGKIKKALGKKDFRLAKRLLHSFKGMAGSIEATLLYQITKRLEKDAGEMDLEAIEALLPDAEKQFNKVLNVIPDILSDASGNCSVGDENTDSINLPEIFRNLSKSLENCSPLESEENLDEIEKTFGAVLIMDDFAAIRKQIDDFDFDSALKTLNGVMEKLKISMCESGKIKNEKNKC